jgi:integrase
MRSGEITGLTWEQVDLDRRVLTVGRAKTSSGTGRQIPLSAELFQVLAAHAKWFTRKFGAARPKYYLFPFGKPSPTDPTRPTTTLKTVWGSIRKDAGLNWAKLPAPRSKGIRRLPRWPKRVLPRVLCLLC